MNIALFLDGTWQEPADHTNISQLYERVAPRDAAGAIQQTYYNPGVGTGGNLWNRWSGGAFGLGLNKGIIDAYRFIAEHHRSADDQIYLFGYSRGAFTARSLAGVIAKCGIVPPEILSAESVFERYRREDESPGLRELQAGEASAETAEDRLLLENSRLVRIRFIGVLDTVGSLGIPGGIGRWLARGRYEFHDTAVSGLVDHAYHAIAIDERRAQFPPALWTGLPAPTDGHVTQVEQRWFVGSHSNIGGGGTSEPRAANPLSVLTRTWLADHAVEAGLALEPSVVPLEGDEWKGPIRPSYSLAFGGFGRFLPGNKRYLRPVRTSVGEALDRSVLLRWNTGEPPYHPDNPNLAPWVEELLEQ